MSLWQYLMNSVQILWPGPKHTKKLVNGRILLIIMYQLPLGYSIALGDQVSTFAPWLENLDDKALRDLKNCYEFLDLLNSFRYSLLAKLASRR